MRNLLYILHPIERFSPDTGGALSTITQSTLTRLNDYKSTVLHLKHNDRCYEDTGCVQVNGKSLMARVLSFPLWKRLSMPYRGQVALAFAALVRLASGTFPIAILFNDESMCLLLSRLLPKVNFLLWYQNFPDNYQLLRLCARRPNVHVLTCSDFVRNTICNQIGRTQNSIMTVRSGSDIALIDNRLTTTTLSILFVGRIDYNKGVDIVVETVAWLTHRGVSVSATIVGNTWFYSSTDHSDESVYYQSLLQKSENLPIRFAGHVDRYSIDQYYQTHDLIMIPSRTEDPSPLVVAEGLRSGCAVVASRKGGITERVEGVGVLVDSDDAVSWCDVIEPLAVDRAKLRDLRQRCADAGLAMTWDKTASDLSVVLSGCKDAG